MGGHVLKLGDPIVRQEVAAKVRERRAAAEDKQWAREQLGRRACGAPSG